MHNTLRAKLQQGEPTLGTFVQLGGTTIIECLALASLDYVVLDLEHGPGSVADAGAQILAAERHHLTPLVRIKDNSRASVMNLLDQGAQGLVIPAIKTVEEVRNVVRYGKYAPLGERGFGPSRASAFTYSPELQDLPQYLESCNREILILPQCETRECLDNVEEIVNLAGVDGLFIGPFDLSIALGIPAQFEADVMQAALQRILTACQVAGKFCFVYADRTRARQRLAQGFHSVATSMDTVEVTRAFQLLVRDVREAK
ncbi:HpcH/HpaI aldolase family protein [Hymenobacter sp. GOD-10R]|uniref:HpcH/HpaI aldolase family protein n=1 Tax=Hymenobacter sp. GOD-10R TaxID=3093922 RepID=UPI002D79235E|nr:aldolase/citrate lyase family protein [Hymenobacter sp. GOD-10R]WRQ27726.1 aldolase/citrate lyase family protein [Hymenobacter sp. GOD-10R]